MVTCYRYRNGSGNNGHYDNGNHHGYGPSGRNGHTRPYNYDSHPHRDHFIYAHAHHNWSRPLPPPPRPYRPAPLRYYRPVIPAHYRPYYGAPVIDRILGITFGTYFDVSLDYLYTSGYYIDGYQENIVYLRDVSMLNLLWPDVMLSYDAGRLANAQFVYASTYRDRSRYNRLYHDLSAVYGPPISVESGMATDAITPPCQSDIKEARSKKQQLASPSGEANCALCIVHYLRVLAHWPGLARSSATLSMVSSWRASYCVSPLW